MVHIKRLEQGINRSLGRMRPFLKKNFKKESSFKLTIPLQHVHNHESVKTVGK